jgi:hypothetical protein
MSPFASQPQTNQATVVISSSPSSSEILDTRFKFLDIRPR